MNKFQAHRIFSFETALGILAKRFPENITCSEVLKPVTGWVGKRVYKIREHIPSASMERYFADWTEHITGYDTVIMGQSVRSREVFEKIRELNPSARLIQTYNDTIDDDGRNNPRHYQGMGIEFYTFDKGDAEKYKSYGMQFKHYFWPNAATVDDAERFMKQQDEPVVKRQEAFFIGADRGRLKYLMSLSDRLKDMGVEAKFHIVGELHGHYYGHQREVITRQRLSYEEVIDEDRHSCAIIDVPQPGQMGLTLRPMEALFFGRKLITTNKDIKNYDFYCPENIFILDEQPDEDIRAFLNAPMKKIPFDIVSGYTAERWLNGFF